MNLSPGNGLTTWTDAGSNLPWPVLVKSLHAK